METGFIEKEVPSLEIVADRTFDVTVSTLFNCFSNPNLLAQWWGPSGFSNTFNEFNFVEGGIWDFVMHGPEKGNYANRCEFLKIVPNTLIAWKRHSQPFFNVVFTFETLSPTQSYLRFRMVFDTVEASEKIRKFVGDKNQENFDKLEALLKG